MSHKRSKRYKEEEKAIDTKKLYSPKEALEILKASSKVKFDAGVEVHFHLGIDPKDATQIVRGSVVLPNGTGKTKKIIAFVTPKEVSEAKEAGADIIGDEECINSIKTTGKCDFDVAIAVPAIMKKLGPVARILGQKGLMPNPKTDTITTNIKKTIQEIKKGKVSFRSDDSGNLHQLIGRISFGVEKLEENLNSFIEIVKRAKPDSSKGTYIQTTFVCSSMGPALHITI